MKNHAIYLLAILFGLKLLQIVRLIILKKILFPNCTIKEVESFEKNSKPQLFLFRMLKNYKDGF